VAEGKKSARRRGALIVFQDESGFSLLPSVRSTWAPRGKTPVLRHHFSWKRLSMAGALAYEPDGTDAQLVFQMCPGAYNDESLIEFLTEKRTCHLALGGSPRGDELDCSEAAGARVSGVPGETRLPPDKDRAGSRVVLQEGDALGDSDRPGRHEREWLHPCQSPRYWLASHGSS
jgi:hypothetical protein